MTCISETLICAIVGYLTDGCMKISHINDLIFSDKFISDLMSKQICDFIDHIKFCFIGELIVIDHFKWLIRHKGN